MLLCQPALTQVKGLYITEADYIANRLSKVTLLSFLKSCFINTNRLHFKLRDDNAYVNGAHVFAFATADQQILKSYSNELFVLVLDQPGLKIYTSYYSTSLNKGLNNDYYFASSFSDNLHELDSKELICLFPSNQTIELAQVLSFHNNSLHFGTSLENTLLLLSTLHQLKKEPAVTN